MSIHWPILKRLLSRPRKICMVDDQRSYRGAEVVVAALHVASAIEARSQSQHVGILLPTGGAFPIAALAIWMLGRTVVPLNYLLKPEELQFVVDDSEIDTIVTAGPMLDYLATPAGGGKIPERAELLRMDQIDFRSVPEPRWPAMSGDDDLGVLLYTSGTSGKPKGVMLTHGNISANVQQCIEFLSVSDREVVLGVLPQFHSFGLTVLTLLPLSLGAKAVYTARFLPAKIMRLIREHQPTIFVAIPSMYNALLHVKDAAPEDFASLRLPVSGGEPLPNAVADGIRKRFGVTITEGYGLTETSPVTNVCRPEEYRPHSVGRPIPRVAERIVDIETGADLPPGRDGEVRIAGPNVMRGYFKRPDETRQVFDEQGFFRTGDIGRFDADGHLYITGRLKEMLIVGGENVFPREIEEVLNAHPHVKDSGVVGKTDPMRGELPVAFVEMREIESAPAEGQTTDPPARYPFNEKELLTWCRGRLAGYKVPDEIRVIDALPRNPTGKVMRRELKKLV
jgi:long-chain acyl-CoA synthetase